MNLREFLAVEVMGYVADVVRRESMNGAEDVIFWQTPDGDLHEGDWRPDELIEQAVMCARKVPHLIGVEFDYRPAGIICTVLTYPNRTEGVQHFTSGLEETEAAALSVSVADAMGWKDE